MVIISISRLLEGVPFAKYMSEVTCVAFDNIVTHLYAMFPFDLINYIQCCKVTDVYYMVLC